MRGTELTTNPETAGVEPVAQTSTGREGPKVSLSCSTCRYFETRSYRVQGDSGFDAFCGATDKRRIGDSIVKTPDWCPFHPAPASNTTSVGELKAALLHCIQVLDLAAGDGLHYRAGGETFDAGDAVFELAKALRIDIANVGDVPGYVVAALLGQTATPLAAIRSGSE